MDLGWIDWDKTGKLTTAVISIAALLLSIFSLWRQRRIIKADVSTRIIYGELAQVLEVYVASTGNHALTIKEVRCVAKSIGPIPISPPPAHNTPISVLSPGGVMYYRIEEPYDWLLCDTVEVVLHDDRILNAAINQDAELHRAWHEMTMNIFDAAIAIFLDGKPWASMIAKKGIADVEVYTNDSATRRILYRFRSLGPFLGRTVVANPANGPTDPTIVAINSILLQKAPDLFVLDGLHEESPLVWNPGALLAASTRERFIEWRKSNGSLHGLDLSAKSSRRR